MLKEEGLPFPQTGPEWRLVYRAMGKVLAARAFLTDTPAEVMQLPVQDVADSKEQMILRAVCDERISVPLESLMQFAEVYKALMDRIGGPGALAEVKVNWRCNTKQWWVGAVPDAVAPSIYRKLGYTDDMIKLMGLDPSAPGCRTGADGPDIRPRGGDGDEGIVYPPITSDNVHGVVGKDYRKKNYPAETKHVFWAHTRRGRGHPPPPDPGRQGHPSAGAGRAAGWPVQPLGQGTVGVLPPGRALCPAARCLRG